MVSVQPVTLTTLGIQHNTKIRKNDNKTPIFYAQNSNSAEKFLDLLALNNRAAVSFGKNTAMQQTMMHPYGKYYDFEAFRPRLSNYAAFRLETEAAARMRGVSAESNEYKWGLAYQGYFILFCP